MAYKLVAFKHVYILLILSFIGKSPTVVVNGDASSDCYFSAIYNFGDSNSATGSSVTSPNGETTFGKPSGRVSDGRLIIDFIGEQLGLGYLSPYANPNGGDFSHGANFAVGGASIRPGHGYSDSNLAVQISQFQQFKTHSSGDFSKSLFTLDIGQNDIAYGFQYSSEDQVRDSIPDILDQFSSAILLLYKEGARIFWVHNTGPFGCLPYSVIYSPTNHDQVGCVKPKNDVAQEFNMLLKDKLAWLRTQLPDSMLTYVDVYSAKYTLISNAKKQGFVDPMNFCCGSYYGVHVQCGQKMNVNGTEYGGSCSNPSTYISWDGVHYCEAANQWVAKHILFGALSDPAVSVKQACHN